MLTRRTFSTSFCLAKGPRNYVNRKTGRGCGNAVLPRFEWRYDKAIGKNFQKSMGIRFGIDMGLEDRILLTSVANKQRRLDDKKMVQLGKIMEQHVSDVISTDETLANLKIQISKVKLDRAFSNLEIFWMCFDGGERDEQTRNILESAKFSIRKRIQEAVGFTCPELKFVADKTHLMEAEMDRIFEKADYGQDYRSLSKTARILGNIEKKSENSEKSAEKIPPWLEAIRNNKKKTIV
ncbi:unnamed protein product [Caenorhabditis angaria]|uniref:Uncharacterized protein n=1 Tax=Caenorhabditis angaria TaxID=860376 RepID=A0A9P1IKT8_9PELO|nr:unnamed protein product [Caenorhabditis angaria]